jgi:hypothetical protein
VAYWGNEPAKSAVKIGDDVILSSHIDDGVIVNADINASAAIATSKISGALTSVAGSHGLGSLAALSTIASAQITDGTIVNADINASAAISISKTQLVAGTGITLATNTLNVDAAQTQITSVGTIGTGVWNGTAVASAYLDADTAHLSGTQTFSGAKTFSDDVTISSGKGLIVSWAEGTNSGSYISQFSNLDSTNNQSNGVLIQAGAGASDKALAVRNYAGTDMFIVKGDSSATFTGDISLASTKKLWFDSANWSIGKLTSPTGASAVTGAAVVVDVYDGSTHGFMVRNTSNESLLEIVGSTKTATFAGALTIHGATAKVWHSAVKPFHIGGVATIGVDVTNGYTQLYENAYLDANDNYKFIENGRATMVYQGNGTHAIRVSTSDNSGGADQALSWTNALLIDNTGNATFAGVVKADYHTLMDGATTCGQFIREETITGSGSSQDVCLFAETGLDLHFMTGGSTTKVLTLDTSNNATFAGYVDGVHTQSVALGGDANSTRYLNLGTKDADNFCVVEISAINSNMVGSTRMAYARWIVARGSYGSGGYVATQLDDYGSGFDSSIALSGSNVRIACAYNTHSHSVNCIVRTINGQFTAISAETT